MFDKKKLYSRVDAEKWAHPEFRAFFSHSYIYPID